MTEMLPWKELVDQAMQSIRAKPPLSPAAQAILDTAMQYEINPECYSREIAAAVLRAAANQLSYLLPFEDSGRVDVADLLDIAAELEALDD